MLTMDARRASRNYAYVGGMYNGAWLTGYVRSMSETGFLLQQNNNLNLALPITLTDGEKLPGRTRETSPLHVICRVEGVFDPETKERTVRMRALGFEQPSILNLPAEAAWNAVLKPGVPTDSFRPVSGGAGKLNANSNIVKVAGLIESAFLTQDKTDPTLIILLRQTENLDKGIPIRVYGKHAPALAGQLRRGTPVLIEGRYQVKVVPLDDEPVNGIVPVKKLPYIHASNIKVATPDDITIVPNWAEEMMRLGSKTPIRTDDRADPTAVEAKATERVNMTPEAEAQLSDVDQL